MFATPFLFGTVGASVIFKEIEGDVLFKALVILFIGLLLRCLVSYIVTLDPKLTKKESLFLAFSWIPKATV